MSHKATLHAQSISIVLSCASFSPSYGGPAFSISQLANALAKEGVKVGLWAPDQTAATTTVIAHDSPVRRLTGTDIEALEQFGHVDVLHDNGIWLQHNHRLARLAQARRIPRVVSTRGMLEPWALNHKKLKKVIAWRLYQRRDLTMASCHHATSAREADNLRELNLSVPVCMIPNGVEMPGDALNHGHNNKNCSGRRCALFLGRIYAVKGLPLLIEAWARVRPSNWQLIIAGPDQADCKAELERAIVAAGIQDSISFIGPVEGVSKHAAFFESELFILPSHSESFGMAIAEALAHGLPVLTTMGAPWPMLVSQGCGWRVETNIEAFCRALREATSSDPETLSAMGAQGRALIASEFRWEVLAKRFLSMYCDLLSSRAAA